MLSIFQNIFFYIINTIISLQLLIDKPIWLQRLSFY